MAKPLSKEQKDINADLVAIGGKAFTEIEFREKDINAKKLEDMKNGTYISALTDPFEAAFEYKTFLHTVAKLRPTNTMESLSDLIINAAHTSSTKALKDILNQINTRIGELGLQTDQIIEIIKECKAQALPINEEFEKVLKEKLKNAKDVNATIIKEATSNALKIENQPLIDQIANNTYLFVNMSHKCPTCGHAAETNNIQRKIDSWAEYCSMVKEYIKFIKETFPNWDKMKTKEKTEVLKYWKLLANAPFAKLQAPYLALFIDFIDNYQLNQDKEAKAKALLTLNLPSITTIEIARDVTTYSSLSK